MNPTAAAYTLTDITLVDLTAEGFTLTDGPNEWTIATKKRSDGKAIQIFVNTDGVAFPKAILVTSGSQVEKVRTSEIYKS